MEPRMRSAVELSRVSQSFTVGCVSLQTQSVLGKSHFATKNVIVEEQTNCFYNCTSGEAACSHRTRLDTKKQTNILRAIKAIRILFGRIYIARAKAFPVHIRRSCKRFIAVRDETYGPKASTR